MLAGSAGDRPETELRLRARDGSYRWFVFSTSFSPVDELVFFSGKDITARKQGEEQLRAAEERFRAVRIDPRRDRLRRHQRPHHLLERGRRRRSSAARRRRCSGARSPS